MQDLYRQYRDRASFLTIYVKEAHPTDEWQMDSNEEEGVCYPQPVTLEDRVAIASDFVERCDYEIPIAIDPAHNPADEAYAGWPERFYVVDESGTIAYKGKTGPFGYHPEEVAAWLMQRFPPVVQLPSDVSEERITKEPLSVRAVEYVDERERWRKAIEAKPESLGDDRMIELRGEIARSGFFTWEEASGEPLVEGRTRILAIQVGDTFKVVHRYSRSEEADSYVTDRFNELWAYLRYYVP